MLDIKLTPSYESLDLGNITINLVSSSPLFNHELKQVALSYNFTIFNTPTNKRLLKLPNVIESPDQFQDFKVLLIINNSVELAADLSIETADNTTVKLKLVAVDFDMDFLKENLSSFNYGDDIDIGPNTADVLTHVKTANTKSYPDTSHVFPMVYNSEFYGDENPEFLGVVNNYDINTAAVIPNVETPTIKNKNTIVPYFFLVYVLKQIFESNNVTLKGSFINHPEVKKLIIHNNFALDQFDIQKTFARASLNNQITIPSVGYPGETLLICDDDSTFPNEDVSSLYNTTNGEFSITQEGTLSFKFFNLTIKSFAVPVYDPVFPKYLKIVVTLYLDGLAFPFGTGTYTYNVHALSFYFSDIFTIPEFTINTNITATDIGKKITAKIAIVGSINNPTPAGFIFDGVMVDMSVNKWSEYNLLETKINSKNHLPNKTAESFVNSFIKAFKLIPYYDKINKELYLDFFADIIADNKYNDISDNVSTFTLNKINNTGFNLRFDFNGDVYLPDISPDRSKFLYIGSFPSKSSLPMPQSISLLAFVTSVNAYFVSKIVSSTLVWERHSESFNKLILLDGSTPYLIEYAPFIMEQLSIDNDGAGAMLDFLLPKISETGSSLFYANGINDPLFKILIWHGMVDGSEVGKPYPFASSFNIDQNGNEIGSLSLRLDEKEDSIFTIFLRKYFDFLINTKKVTHIYTPDLKNPINYNFQEKKLINNQRFLTEKLKLKITKKGFESIVAENYTV